MTTIIKEITDMKVKINDLSAGVSILQLAKIRDIYGRVIVVKGWL